MNKLVNIVMSIYNPNMEYFEKQVKSLDEQNYNNIEILIWDDNPKSTFDSNILDKLISNKKYKYIKCDKNLGYAKAFERLTNMADGEYIAYCDQDDIWMKNKITRCVEALEKENAVLVTADRALIDENDNMFVKSCRNEQRDICNGWNTGDNIVTIAIFNTCAIGMNIVMRTDIAKELLPLPEGAAHDKWLTAGAATKGRLVFLDDVLVWYRRHKKNVSGAFSGISDKAGYYEHRVEYSYQLAKDYLDRFKNIPDNDKKAIMEFANARRDKNCGKIWKYRKLSPNVAKFEIVLKFMPDFVFRKMFLKK